uniref:Putative secreted protein n=1 Tax=Anopheles triannulatus TaxID=58253 RepID=A0A2M4B5Q1_9DIPT
MDRFVSGCGACGCMFWLASSHSAGRGKLFEKYEKPPTGPWALFLEEFYVCDSYARNFRNYGTMTTTTIVPRGARSPEQEPTRRR